MDHTYSPRSTIAWIARSTIALVSLTVVAMGIGGPLAGQQPSDSETQETEVKNENLPLPVDRTVPVDLTEGSWISVDVSPDGTTIVFDFLGDLFTIPMAGGDATQLTSGMAFDAQPRFSPDGQHIVYTSDYDGGQNIWVRSLDGLDTTQISKGAANRAESPEWIDDDYVVASLGNFRGGGLPKLRMFHVDGGSGIQLVSEPGNLKMLGAAISADGRHVWYARRTGDWNYNAQMPQYQLESYDRETGERYTKSSRYGSGIRPTLSPDGRWLVYGTRHDQDTGLLIRDLDSGSERWLAYPIQHDDQESRATLDVLPGMSFTPDSRYLVASYGGKIWKVGVDDGTAEEIPFRVRMDLTLGPRVDFDYPIEDTPTFTVRQIRNARPSPSGDQIAFTALDRLWVSDADGSDPRRLTDADMSEHFPAWSPDGDWIAYATWDGDEGHLRKVRSDGSGGPVRLTRASAAYFAPVWGPEDRIVAMRGFERTYVTQGASGPPGQEIIWLPADPPSNEGSSATVIAPTDGRSAPHFVEASDRLYLFRSPDLLVSIRMDGTDEKEHVRVRGPTVQGSTQGLSPSTIIMAPQGDQALLELQREVYTVTVPQAGVTPTINVSNPENAAFPSRKVTQIGGEFPAWSADGRTVHFSLGNAFFSYNLDAAQAFDDSVAAAEDAAQEDDAGGDAEGAEQDEVTDEEEEDEEDQEFQATEVRVVVEAPRDIPEGEIVLRGARIITMRGDEVIENGDLLVRNNRIVAVGEAGSVEIPEGAETRNVTGRTIVPGYVDTHAHLRARDQLHRTDVWPYLANLAYGVTTTRDPQTGNTEVLSYADMVRTGSVLGPRVYSTGPGVFWQDGIDTEEEAMNALSRYAEYFDTKTIKMYVAAARKGRQHIIAAARKLKLMPTTEGSLNIRQNLTETIDGVSGPRTLSPDLPGI